MNRRMYLSGVVALCATILVSAGLLAQDNPYGDMSPEQQAMMKAWMDYGTPGEEHAQLANRVGVWEVQGKMWHEPNSEPEPFTGTSTIESIMGGRYFIEKIEGPGMTGRPPFEGRSIFGYDNLSETYFSIWIDNTMTGALRYEGTAGDDGKTIRYTVDMPDLVSGRYKKGRAVDETIDKDHSVFTVYDTTPDGDEFMSMQINVTRKGTSKKGY